MTDDPLVRRILDEADISARPGQYDRLVQIANEVRELLQDREWIEGFLHGLDHGYNSDEEARR